MVSPPGLVRFLVEMPACSEKRFAWVLLAFFVNGQRSRVTRFRTLDLQRWKHLRRYDASAIGRMGATAHAGRAGNLLGRLRMLETYPLCARKAGSRYWNE
jgi:hypothetical protein